MKNKFIGKSILIIGGGTLQVPVIETAKKMGLTTVVSDLQKNAPGMLLADYPLLMSTRDIDGTVREAKKYHRKHPINGVLTAGTDASMAVSAVANVLDLPGIKFTDAEAASNKIKMRTRFKEHFLPSPKFIPVWSKEEAYKAATRLGFPLVSKPADNMGARGVIKVYNIDEVEKAYLHSKQNSPTGEVLLEEFMPGPELSIDALIWDNNIEITGIADRIIEQDPYFIEIGHSMPSDLPGKHIQDAITIMKAGIKALGITRGAAKGDIKITPEGAKIGEIAARLSGGYMSSHTFNYSTGINLLKAAIEISLGYAPSDLKNKKNLVAIERALICPSGKIVSIKGKKEAEKISGVKNIFFHKKEGDEVSKLTSNIGKVANVIITAKTLKDAESIFEKVQEKLKIKISENNLTQEAINKEARKRFSSSVCIACKVCDGQKCVSSVPGMGAVNNNGAFFENQKALKNICIVPAFLHKSVKADTSIIIFGHKFSSPVFAAPVTGTTTNMNSALSEKTYAEIVAEAFHLENSLCFLGDGADPEKYRIALDTIKKIKTPSVAVFKPRENKNEIIKRIKAAEEAGAQAVGIDIDSVNIETFKRKNQPTASLSEKDLELLRKETSLPFVLKGILHKDDALLADKLGFEAIVVSNHGGRILSSLPATAKVLPGIKNALNEKNSKMKVLVDGGIRSGEDVFKMLALGADAVLIGRPVTINAVGGGIPGIRLLIQNYQKSLQKVMTAAGKSSLREINKNDILLPPDFF